MSGPIIRSGASPQFTENWERIFGGKKSKTKEAKVAATKSDAKPAKKATPKKKK